MDEKVYLEDLFVQLLDELKNRRPGDRSLRDRAFAVVITMVEQAYAYFMLYTNGEKE